MAQIVLSHTHQGLFFGYVFKPILPHFHQDHFFFFFLARVNIEHLFMKKQLTQPPAHSICKDYDLPYIHDRHFAHLKHKQIDWMYMRQSPPGITGEWRLSQYFWFLMPSSSCFVWVVVERLLVAAQSFSKNLLLLETEVLIQDYWPVAVLQKLTGILFDPLHDWMRDRNGKYMYL